MTFTWSAEGRLTGMTVNGQAVAFEYDAAGRLLRKSVGGVVQRHFLWEGASLLAELNGTGTGKEAEYSYYPGLDNPHALIVGATQYFAHTDGLGNVIALTDTFKTVQRTYAFGSWGQLTGGVDYAGFAGKDRARFKGALWLGPEAEVYYMRNRWYEPKTGRFLGEDPIWLAGGFNLYTFASDDPVNGADPLGLDDEEDEETPCRDDEVVMITPGTYNGASGDYYTCKNADGSTYEVFVRYSDGRSPNSITVSAPAPSRGSDPWLVIGQAWRALRDGVEVRSEIDPHKGRHVHIRQYGRQFGEIIKDGQVRAHGRGPSIPARVLKILRNFGYVRMPIVCLGCASFYELNSPNLFGVPLGT